VANKKNPFNPRNLWQKNFVSFEKKNSPADFADQADKINSAQSAEFAREKLCAPITIGIA
jgi:hypothetical protein